MNTQTAEVKRRTFAASQFPKGSPIRSMLNKDTLTSEYYTSMKWLAVVYHPETKTHTAYESKKTCRTKGEAEQFVLNILKNKQP